MTPPNIYHLLMQVITPINMLLSLCFSWVVLLLQPSFLWCSTYYIHAKLVATQRGKKNLDAAFSNLTAILSFHNKLSLNLPHSIIRIFFLNWLFLKGFGPSTWRRKINISGEIERGVKFNHCGSFWKDLAHFVVVVYLKKTNQNIS